MLISGAGIFGQNPAFFKIGEEEFANSEIYTLLFNEREDALYVGTNNGLYVSKQNSFIQLKTPESQIGNSIFSLKENEDGTVFCSNLNGQLFQVKGDSISLFHQAKTENGTYNIGYFFIENKSIFIYTANEQYVLNQKGEITNKIKGKYVKSASQVSNGAIYLTFDNSNTVFRYQAGVLDSLEVDFANVLAFSIFFEMDNRTFSMCNGGNLNSSKPAIVQNYTPKNKEQLFLYDADELLGLDQKKGVHFLKYHNDTLSEGQHFFDDTFMSSFCKKRSGMLFFGTFGEGVYVVPNRSIISSTYEELFLGSTILNDTLIVSTRTGKVYKYYKDLQLVGIQDFNIDKIFNVYGDFSFDEIPEKGLMYVTKYEIHYALKDVYQINDTLLLEAHSNGVDIRSSNQIKSLGNLDFRRKSPKRFSVFLGKRCYSVAWSPKDSLIYYGTGLGVFMKEWSSKKTKVLLFNEKTFFGNDLEFNNDTLSCGTEKHGLLFYKNGKLLFQISKKDGLKSNAIKKHKVLGNKVFILSKNGMQIYDLDDKYFIEPNIKEGIFNSKITNFEISNNTLWLLEKHRLFNVNLNTVYDEEKIAQLYIDSITINKKEIAYNRQSSFKYTQNEISIFFDYRNIETKSETSINYTLEGFYKEWKRIGVDQNQITFEYLPVGKYTFKMKAVYRNQETETFEYFFEIVAPFWQQWWFYILLAVVFTSLVLLIFFRRLKRQKVKSELLNEINTSRLTAIQSQMNPHFIFNALNSIQALVLRGDVDNSYAYINKFSSLVRKTLSYSEKDFIDFESELELIEVYLVLEKLRFEDNFSYTIRRPLDEEFMIPPMLIQPFIENTLVHGLLHKEGGKTLDILFELKEALICTITDNGIGRVAAYEINKRQNSQHESFAIKAIQNRLDILSKRYQNPIGFVYEDLYTENGDSLGTKVVITIPIKVEF